MTATAIQVTGTNRQEVIEQIILAGLRPTWHLKRCNKQPLAHERNRPMATYHGEYGTLETGQFVGRRRRDVWTSKATGEQFTEPAFATGPDDDSRRHDHTIGHGYNPRCSCCWLGFTHTERYHRQAIK